MMRGRKTPRVPRPTYRASVSHYAGTITTKPSLEHNTWSMQERTSQAQFHWHEGESRLTLNPVSRRNADTSSRRSVSSPFAYHGLPYLLEPVFRAWQSLRPRYAPPSGPRLSSQGMSLHDFHPVIQAQFLGEHFKIIVKFSC